MKNLALVIALVLIGLAVWGIISVANNQKQSSDLPKEEREVYSDAMNTENKKAIINTNHGEFTLELYPDQAPKTVENFEKLANKGFYNNTKFHRIIDDFMIQGGDPLSADDSKQDRWGTGGPGYEFADEPNEVALVEGVIAMANSGPNTNGSQFFIITAEATPWLQGKHTGFGRVVEGYDVVNKIGQVETGERDVPLQPVIVESVTVQ